MKQIPVTRQDAQFGLGTHVVPTGQPDRLVALDHLRGFVVALVVLHHAVLAYCRFGHFDRRHYLLSTAPVIDTGHWLGFDLLVLLNDSFFMPLMFLLSGLFVWRSLRRKGPHCYVRDRLLRLGVPFAIAVMTMVPLAYYPSFRLTGSATGFAAFWVGMVFVGPWPSGPPWFVAVLLLFDAGAALLFHLIQRRAGSGPGAVPGVAACFGLLVALSAASYLPLLALFGPVRWLAFGPVAVQASRIGLYGLYFAAGAAFGAHSARRDAPLFTGAPAKAWPGWALLAALSGGILVAIQVARLQAGATLPALAWSALYGCAFLTFCAAACFALLAIFLRFGGKRHAAWDSLSANAYGIYPLHYPVVTWTQYNLLGRPLNALAKAVLVFPAALLLSWAASGLLRRVPGLARMV